MAIKIWAWVITVTAYSLPIIVGVAVTGDLWILWAVVCMLLTLLIFLIGADNHSGTSLEDLEGKKQLVAASMTFLLGIVVTTLIYVTTASVILWLTVVMFFLSWMFYFMVNE